MCGPPSPPDDDTGGGASRRFDRDDAVSTFRTGCAGVTGANRSQDGSEPPIARRNTLSSVTATGSAYGDGCRAGCQVWIVIPAAMVPP
jgi:hypothetical protein